MLLFLDMADGSSSCSSIAKQIEEQGDIVKSLKASKADKAQVCFFSDPMILRLMLLFRSSFIRDQHYGFAHLYKQPCRLISSQVVPRLL